MFIRKHTAYTADKKALNEKVSPYVYYTLIKTSIHNSHILIFGSLLDDFSIFGVSSLIKQKIG